MTVVPQASSTLLLSDMGTGELLRRRWSLEVIEGPDAGKEIVRDNGTLIVGSHTDADFVLTDPSVSRRHATFELLSEGVLVVDCESRNGTHLGKRRVDRALVAPGGIIRLGRTRIKIAAKDESVHLDAGGVRRFGGFVTAQAGLARTLGRLELVARTEVTVLIEGESGTGKRLLARTIHEHSDRSSKPLVLVDCDAPGAEALLFGKSVPGGEANAFERAEGGTMVLTDIASLSANLQIKMLEVIEMRRISAPTPHAIDIRFIVTEHRDLEDRVRAAEFSEELYYRVAVVRAKVTPLRDRPEDLAELARHFAVLAGGQRASLTEEALRSLAQYDWPGNGRELERVIQRAVAYAGGSPIGPDDLLPEALERGPRPFHEAKEGLISEFERRYVRALLLRHNGNVSGAARDAGLSRGAFYALMKRAGLEGET